jgi:Tol biopolymer transport system component
MTGDSFAHVAAAKLCMSPKYSLRGSKKVSANQTPRTRLDSWKDIARYLKKHERTVIRWEKKNGLPVHRVPGEGNQAVFAYVDEIDAWLVSRDRNSKDQGTADNGTDLQVIRERQESFLRPESIAVAPASEPKYLTVPAKRHYKWMLVVVCLVSLLVLFSFVRSQTPAAIHLVRFVPLTDDGRAKAGIRTDGTALYFTEFEVNRKILATSPIGGGPVRQINTPFPNVELEDISNDGQNLLVTSFEGQEWERRLWIMPVRGGTAHPVGDVMCHYARWSPDNRRIACITGTTIILIDPDGSSPRTVGSFSLSPSGLMWAPNGEQLRFVLDQSTRANSAWEISINKDGSAGVAVPSKLPSEQNSIVNWAWTRTGKNFVYTKRQRDGKLAVFVKPKNHWLSGRAREIEFPVGVRTVEAIISGNTDNIVYLLIGDANRGVLLKFDSQKKVFQTLLHGLSAAAFLSFSKDGQWITYQNTLDYSLWRSRADGTDPVQLTKPPMAVEFSAWSPDDRQIAFMGQLPGKPWRIYLIGRDGGVPEEAALSNDAQGAPTWSPDGKALTYGNVTCEETQTCWIRRVDLASRKVDKLPGSRGFRTARWSPDGKYIAALQNEAHELMLFDVRRRHWTILADSITGDNINWASDSQSIYADSPEGQRPVIEQIRIKDRRRTTVVDLAPLQNISGRVEFWFGLTPDNSTILVHGLAASEVYVLEWADQ